MHNKQEFNKNVSPKLFNPIWKKIKIIRWLIIRTPKRKKNLIIYKCLKRKNQNSRKKW